MVAQKYNKIFFAYFSPEQDKWLRKEAKRLDISISALIRMCVQDRATGFITEFATPKEVAKLKGEQKR